LGTTALADELQSCSNPVKMWFLNFLLVHIFEMWKVLDFVILWMTSQYGDRLSFTHFWPRSLEPGCQCQEPIFDSSFYWKPGYNPSLYSP